MIERERHQQIIDQLHQRRFASTIELCQATGASEATLRRDLAKLDKQGLIQRVHGGAELIASADLPSVGPYGEADQLDAKMRIAKAAADMIEDGETIIIDSGSTTFQMCGFLKQRQLTILTNSFPIAEQLYHHSDNTVVLSPGEIARHHHAIFNPFGEDYFAHYSCSKVFLGVQGLDEVGVTNVDTQVIQAEQQMLRHGKQRIILADSSKFGREGNLRLCSYEDIDCIITDSGIDEQTKMMLAKRALKLIIV